jgi:hypothetical protein
MTNKLLLVNSVTGLVEDTIYPFDASSFQANDYFGQIPYVVDASFSPLSAQTTIARIDGTTASVTVSLPPQTEQKITGTVYGKFSSGELAFQSPITATVVNVYTSGGITDSAYTPVVAENIGGGTIKGNAGFRCAQFAGSPILSESAGAITVNDYTYSVGATLDHLLVSGFLYMDEDPSGYYDAIVVAKVQGGTVDSVNDAFLMEYDNSSKKFQLKVADQGRTLAGFVATVVDASTSNSSSVLLGSWHHFAFAYSNSGGSGCVSTYWNGNRIGQITGLSGSLRRTSAPFSVGGGPSGAYPFKGYIDNLIISGGTSSAALRGIGHGTTYTIPTENQETGQYTIAALSMDGPVGTSYFPCDVSAKVLSNIGHLSVVRNTSSDLLYTGNIVTVQDTVHGVTVFAGVCSGHAVHGVCGAGPIFGYESGACCVVSGVEQLLTVAQSRNAKSQLVDNTFYFLLGVTSGMNGTTGASGDFPNLYSGHYTAGSFSFVPTKYNIDTLRSLNDYIVGSGNSGEQFNIQTAEGVTVTMSGTAITKLYLDAVTYYSAAYQDTASVRSAVLGSSTISSVRSIPGLTRPSFVQKLASFGGSQYPDIVLNPESKVTKTYNRSESRYTTNPRGIVSLK